jgi:hypothetical protein
MRFRNAAILAALAMLVLAGVATLLSGRRHQPLRGLVGGADGLVLDIFDASNPRTLKVHTSAAQAGALDGSTIGKSYNALDPARSVLISDHTKFSGRDYLGFQSVFTLAAKAVSYDHPDPDGLYQAWYKGITAQWMDPRLSQMLPYQPLASNQFQLLAVANRMDMASWNGTYWNGAEIHFVYGPVPGPGAAVTELTLILEFELAPDRTRGFTRPEFQKIAVNWASLSKPQPSYPDALKDALRASGLPFQAGDQCWIKRVHLRTNRKMNSAQWRLTQSLLDPATGSTFSAAALDDEIKKPIANADLLYLWKLADGALQASPGQYSVPGKYLEGAARTYTQTEDILGMPAGLCGDSRTTRNVLGLQECTGCHKNEAKTPFTHIANRRPDRDAVLSGFLVGKSGNLRPILDDLYIGADSVVWPVEVEYQYYTGTGASCTTQATAGPVVKFHDVARRTIFLAAAMNDIPTHRDGPPAAQLLSTRSIE